MQIVAANFYQRRLCHATWTFERHTPKSLHKSLDGLSFLLLYSEESWHGYFGIIFEESRQEELLEVGPFLDRASRKSYELFKGDPLESVNK